MNREAERIEVTHTTARGLLVSTRLVLSTPSKAWLTLDQQQEIVENAVVRARRPLSIDMNRDRAAMIGIEMTDAALRRHPRTSIATFLARMPVPREPLSILSLTPRSYLTKWAFPTLASGGG